MNRHPGLFCLSRDYQHTQGPMPLPLSTLRHVPEDQVEWPNDGSWLYVACPECNRVFAYSKIDLLPSPPAGPHSDKFWLRISFRCAVENCGTPVQFHALVETTLTETTMTEWREKLANGYWKGAALCGHHIANNQRAKSSL
jgi:hypothetical protein